MSSHLTLSVIVVRGCEEQQNHVLHARGYTGDCSCLLLNAKIWPGRRTRGRASENVRWCARARGRARGVTLNFPSSADSLQTPPSSFLPFLLPRVTFVSRSLFTLLSRSQLRVRELVRTKRKSSGGRAGGTARGGEISRRDKKRAGCAPAGLSKAAVMPGCVK